MVQHVGIKLAPTKFAAVVIVIRVGAQLGEQLARMQYTETQVGRQHAAPVTIGVVAFFFVSAERVAGEMFPTIPRGFFAAGRQRGSTLGFLRNAVALHVRGTAQVHVLGCRKRLAPTFCDPPT